MIQTNLLIYYALSFCAVVKAGSFSRAAKKFGTSKAQLSRHVSALEDLLGIQLLHRSTRSIALTEQGKQFFTAYEAIEEDCVAAINHIKHDVKEMQGTLKITAPIDFGIQFLTPLIHQFSKHYPNMNILLSLSNDNENLAENNFDLAIRIANQLPNSNLRMSKILAFKRIICASPYYLKNKELPKNPQELKNYLCITSVNRNIDTLYPSWQFKNNNKIINYRLEKFIEVDSLFAQLELIKLGTGIGRMPDYFIEKDLHSGDLIELLPGIEKPDTHIYVLYPNVKTLPQKTRTFIDFIKAHDFLNFTDNVS